MKRWEVIVGEEAKKGAVCQQVEAAFGGLDLQCTMRGTLAKYPGSAHWHLKQGKAKGVIEVTVWERQGALEVWVSVQAGRSTVEVEAMAEKLSKLLSKS